MRTDPTNVTLTPEMEALLSKIFRVLIKEIESDDDKYKLAPGELGINYGNGTLYIRNPHTGELFSPNSLDHMKHILAKFDTRKHTLNADTVNGVNVYTRLSQLDKLSIDFSPDSIIRQMHAPGMFFGYIAYENYETLGWPSEQGMCLCYKLSDNYAIIHYYDNRTYTIYDGKYDYQNQMFEGWGIGTGIGTVAYTEVQFDSDENDVVALVKQSISDLDVITARTLEQIEPDAMIRVNGADHLPLVNLSGEPLSNPIPPNTIIMLIYDEVKSQWIYFDPTTSAVLVTLKIVSERNKNASLAVNGIIGSIGSIGNDIADIKAALVEIRKAHTIDLAELKSVIDEEHRVALNAMATSLENDYNAKIAAAVAATEAKCSRDLRTAIGDLETRLRAEYEQKLRELESELRDEMNNIASTVPTAPDTPEVPTDYYLESVNNTSNITQIASLKRYNVLDLDTEESFDVTDFSIYEFEDIVEPVPPPPPPVTYTGIHLGGLDDSDSVEITSENKSKLSVVDLDSGVDQEIGDISSYSLEDI